MRRAPELGVGQLLTIGTVLAATALFAALAGRPAIAWLAGPIAGAALLTVLRHLVNRENRP
ncbi:hypothetical protein COA17_11215 [Sphingomonas ginsenosidimutans]|jgi:hypothetical protein|uniref:Uncharacterized protein n=1 Tax=Sphingomonas ginsenosidimutans TaxID=862134 RepID=A0A2A4HYH6_9SPHN|nr:hypothetical protein [Sphingomonas ginsenosidimutans]PCG08717.1 hypothetical protein COA17_11215 [Sphingomonas ginsenosidimutans]